MLCRETKFMMMLPFFSNKQRNCNKQRPNRTRDLWIPLHLFTLKGCKHGKSDQMTGVWRNADGRLTFASKIYFPQQAAGRVQVWCFQPFYLENCLSWWFDSERFKPQHSRTAVPWCEWKCADNLLTTCLLQVVQNYKRMDENNKIPNCMYNLFQLSNNVTEIHPSPPPQHHMS